MTICLSMIVKDEAHCIEKCLKSVKPYINYWIISDTGSSDNTEEVVTKCLDGIPGEFHHHEWKDFSTNRNIALQLAKDKADYILIIDADDYLVTNGNPFENLDAQAYSINIHHGPIQYNRIQLIHNSIECKYVGVLHEYLEIPLNIFQETLMNCYIFFGAQGSRSKDPNKYYQDAQVFEKVLESEPNNSRYVFYCAQSYRDAGRLAKALNYYKKRSEMGGWNEEVYISLLEMAKINEKINPFDSQSVEAMYLKAFIFLPTRAEPLCYLASYCRNRGFYEKAYFYAQTGLGIKRPCDGLFIETICYDWRLSDELAIACYYTGKKQAGAFLNKQILKIPDLDKADRDRIAKNLQYCTS